MSTLTTKEVKDFLNLNDVTKDKYIQEMIPDAIQFVRDYCSTPELEIKGGVKIAVIKIIEFYMSNSNIQSESISRMSRTYFDQLPASILELLEPYNNKVKFL